MELSRVLREVGPRLPEWMLEYEGEELLLAASVAEAVEEQLWRRGLLREPPLPWTHLARWWLQDGDQPGNGASPPTRHAWGGDTPRHCRVREYGSGWAVLVYSPRVGEEGDEGEAHRVWVRTTRTGQLLAECRCSRPCPARPAAVEAVRAWIQARERTGDPRPIMPEPLVTAPEDDERPGVAPYAGLLDLSWSPADTVLPPGWFTPPPWAYDAAGLRRPVEEVRKHPLYGRLEPGYRSLLDRWLGADWTPEVEHLWEAPPKEEREEEEGEED